MLKCKDCVELNTPDDYGIKCWCCWCFDKFGTKIPDGKGEVKKE